MKFRQLTLGRRFRYRGDIYRKDSPLQALRESDQVRRLIPRSAAITPLDADDGPEVPAPPARIGRQAVAQALGELQRELTAALARTSPALDDAQQQQLQAAIGRASERFLAHIASNDVIGENG